MPVRLRRTTDRTLLQRLQLEILPYDDPITLLPTDYAWVAWDGTAPVGFAVLRPVRSDPGYGYLARAGVVPSHRGRGLQKRLIQVRGRQARAAGMRMLVTDTRPDNFGSANSLIRSGFKLYRPGVKWSYRDQLYWIKRI